MRHFSGSYYSSFCTPINIVLPFSLNIVVLENVINKRRMNDCLSVAG